MPLAEATTPDVPPDMPLEVRLLASLPIGVGYIRDTRFEFANVPLLKILGTTHERLIGRVVFDVIAPEDVDKVRRRYDARRLGEVVPRAYEIDVLRDDGTRVHVEIEPRSITDAETVFTVRDLTEKAREGELLLALSQLAVKVQRARTVEEVLHRACFGVHALGFQAGILQLQGDVFRVVALRIEAESAAVLERITGRPLVGLEVPQGAARYVDEALRERRPLFLDDPATAIAEVLRCLGHAVPRDLTRLVEEAHLSKLVVVPLMVRDRPWGAFMVGASRLASNDAAALSLFGSHIGSALDVALSIHRLHAQRRQIEAVHNAGSTDQDEPLEKLVGELLRIVSEATASDAASMFLLDAEQRALQYAGSFNHDGPLDEARRCVPVQTTERGDPVLAMKPMALDVDGWPNETRADMAAWGSREFAIIPLVLNGHPAGALNLVRKRPVPYTEEELRSAEVLAGQIALQVERARLYAEARRRVTELSQINELGAILAQQLDLEHVLTTAMRYCSQIVGIPNTFLLLLEPGAKALRFAAVTGSMTEVAGSAIPLDQRSVAVEAVRTRAPVVVEDATADPRVDQALVDRFGHKSLIGVPLVAEGRVLGSIVMGETRFRRRFSKPEIDRAVTVATLLASAIENAKLYQEQRRRVEQLKLLVEMSQVITGSLELQQILEASAQSVARMVDATDAFIWFLEDTDLRGVVASSPEFQEHFARVRLPLSEASAVSNAITSRAPVRVEDATACPRVNQTLNAVYRQKSLLALPLMLREVPIGAIAIGDRRRHRVFTEDEVERALLISRQVAVAIDNARLFEDLKRSYHELARAQQELVKRERLAALGELSAVVAHEVRNPLGVIFNSLASLKRIVSPATDARMLLGIVGEEADRLNRMVSDLLDFARPNEPQLHPDVLNEVVQGALEAASRALPAPQVRVEFTPDPSVPLVPMDAQMLRQAVVNLVVNAIQAMPRGGVVKVRTGVERRGALSFARIEVQDNGPGIPPELTDRVFQPFFTTKAAGTGLGLAVVKRIADAHRAELTVRSAPQSGSTFTMLLPF